MPHIGAEKAIFCGHDWGGFVVWYMSVRHPDRVAGVISLNTPFQPRAPADPLFDKPYEPSQPSDAPPSWEAAAKPTTSRLSPNIKTRKKVAALFKSAPAPETNPTENA